jgi:6-phosphogluconolactonase (cycloisomerase 2 family)
MELLGFMPQSNLAAQSTGDVYVLSNQQDGNAVIVFHRSADGTLTPADRFSTGGNGAGEGPDPLSSQGAVILSNDNRMLFAVNAGSNSITAFSVSGDQLTRLQTIPSGGERPVSLTISHDVLYVLNAGESPNISGFRVEPGETPLVAIEGSTQRIPDGAAAAPAEVSFTPDGAAILVTEKGMSQIASFTVSEGGQAHFAYTYPSSAANPFGFAWAHGSIVVAAYMAHEEPGQASAGSYRVSDDGDVTPVSPAVNDGGTASTRVAVTRDGQNAFIANSVSGTISTFVVSSDSGSLALAQPVAARLVGGRGAEDSGSLYPADLALSNNSSFLYVRNGQNGTVSGFEVHQDGSLTPMTHASGLPSSAAGIAAR